MESESETVISENEIPRFLHEYLSLALQFIVKGEFQSALEALSHSQELLDAVISQNAYIDSDFIIATFHNTALCYQRLGELQECASALYACITTSQRLIAQKYQPSPSPLSIDERIIKLQYISKLHLQLCAVFSQLGQHEDALQHAKEGLSKIQENVNLNLKVCQDHLERHEKLTHLSALRKRVQNQQQYKLFESPHYKSYHKTVTKAIPILKFLDEDANCNNKKMKISLKQDDEEFEWINEYNIGDIMAIEPLGIEELKGLVNVSPSLSKDMLLEKICLMIAANFCVATEIRFLIENGANEYYLLESKVWLQKSLKFGENLLPEECPLLAYIRMFFHKYYKDEVRKPVDKSAKFSNDNFLFAKAMLRSKTPQPVVNHSVRKTYKQNVFKNSTNLNKKEKLSNSAHKPKHKRNKKSNSYLEDDLQSSNRNVSKEEKKPLEVSYPVPYHQLHEKLEKIQSQESEPSSSEDYPVHFANKSKNTKF
ncbi:unnamed protein product [Blepharisma stoltei]|uniref:Uncharacterized protein n=1 Tax=Blepharisma stoltei TaxID=1481888 RepID=A0AAU9I9N6_9CILI|nr:unnamed protein product [Blepharisma stoltei]